MGTNGLCIDLNLDYRFRKVIIRKVYALLQFELCVKVEEKEIAITINSAKFSLGCPLLKDIPLQTSFYIAPKFITKYLILLSYSIQKNEGHPLHLFSGLPPSRQPPQQAQRRCPTGRLRC